MVPIIDIRRRFGKSQSSFGLAAVDLSPELRARILREGLDVARIEDEVFALDVPDDFQPRAD